MKDYPRYEKGIYWLNDKKIISQLKMEGIYLEFDEPPNGNLSIDNFYSCYTEGHINGAVKPAIPAKIKNSV
jgi:hypothetical protein